MSKRLFDFCVSLLGLIFLSPLFLWVALLIKLDSPGSVFHRALRTGKDGLPFRIYKFRTMVVDAANKSFSRASWRWKASILPSAR